MCQRPHLRVSQPPSCGLLASNLVASIEVSLNDLAVKVKSKDQALYTTSHNHDNTGIGVHKMLKSENYDASFKSCQLNKNLDPSTGFKRRRRRLSESDPGYTANNRKRVYVQHNYHDHVNDPVEEDVFEAQKGTRGGVALPFPYVLHTLLAEGDALGLSHIVSWKPHGRAFIVHDADAFVKDVLPYYYRHKKMSSFQRQLNLYGFMRLNSTGPDKGAYYHEYFLRGRRDLCLFMQRTRIKGTGVRTSSSPETEPDFYSMSPLSAPADEPESKTTTADRALSCPTSPIPNTANTSTETSRTKLDLGLLQPRPLPPPFDVTPVSKVVQPAGAKEQLFHVSLPIPRSFSPIPADAISSMPVEAKELDQFLSEIDLS